MLMLPSATGTTAGTMTMTASRIADIIAMINEHTIDKTMSGKQVAAFCAMINAHYHELMTAPRMLCEGVDGIGSYKLMRRLGKGGCVRIVMAQRRSTGRPSPSRPSTRVAARGAPTSASC
jgi:hypothetical protein